MSVKWNTLQAEQIELGLRAGLSRKQIRRYAKHRYDFLQMQEIRTALEEGLDEYQLGAMCHAKLSHEEMEAIRRKIENHETVRRRIPVRTYLIGFALALCALSLILEGYLHCCEHPYLSLCTNEIEIGLNEPFDAMAYVKSCSKDADKLKLPADLDTGTGGVKAAVYTLCKGNEELTRILLVHVKEKDSP